jgi:hypothetical protein
MLVQYVVREYNENDESGVLDLLDLAFPNNNISTDYLTWKYFDNPLKKQIIAVTEYDNTIVGVSCCLFREIKLGENIYVIGYGGDLAVHHEHRRKGLTNMMTDLKEEIQNRDGTELCSCITVNPILIDRHNRRGNCANMPKKLLEMVYIEDAKKEDLNLIKGLGYQAYKYTKKLLNRNNQKDECIEIMKVKSFKSEADVFWEKIKDHYYLMFKRDATYLNWRYCDPRAGGFNVYEAVSDNEMCGYCVTFVDSNSIGYVADLCVLPDRNVVTHLLLNKAVETLVERVNKIKYLISDGHPNVAIFSGNGFIPVNSELDIRYKERSENVRLDYSKYYNAPSEKLFIQYGDTDLF